MSQHPKFNDTINGADTTDEHTPNSTSNPIDIDSSGNQEATPHSDKHIRIVNTFMKRRTHMNKKCRASLDGTRVLQIFGQ